MSVYTRVEADQLEQFLQRYDVGRSLELRPIAAGITNTNYYLDTESGRFVLTLYEHHSDDELDFMLGLQQHLADRGVACPAPLQDRRGGRYSMLNHRPAAIIHRLDGEVQAQPGIEHCRAVGAEIARFHLQGSDFGARRPNPRGLEWLLAVSDMLEAELDSAQRKLLGQTLRDYRRLDRGDLPAGAIHADLFHDNALFVDGRLGGIFDFDYACQDYLVFDIAVLLNDWCIDREAALDPARSTALIEAYHSLRPLQANEIEALPLMLRFTALRFWMSRLHDRVFPMSGELTYSKDPGIFYRMAAARSREQTQLEGLLVPHDMR